MKKLNTLLIGCGSMGKNHARVINELPGFHLLGIVEPNPVFVPSNTAVFPNLIQAPTNPDVVVIASPNATHTHFAKKFMGKCKALFIEKPLASNLREAKYLLKSALNTNTYMQAGHIERYNPAFQLLQKKCHAGFLGPLYRLEFQRIGPFPQRIGDSGVGTDLAVHDIDLSLCLTNKRPLWLFCHTENRIHKKFEDGFNLLMELSGSIMCQYTTNWLSPRKQRWLNVYGHKGMLRCDFLKQELTFYENKLNRHKPDEFGIHGIEVGKEKKYRVKTVEPLKQELQNFYNNAIHFKNYQKTNSQALEDAVLTIDIAGKALLSARQGKKVKF